MYEKFGTIALKNSISIFPNNLSVLSHNKTVFLASVSKNSVLLNYLDENGSLLNAKQIFPTLTKEVSSSPDLQSLTIIEASLLKTVDRRVLAIASTKAFFIYDENGEKLLYFHDFRKINPNSSEDTKYIRGMAIINPNILAVGTSTGTVLLFEISSNGTNIEVVNELVEKYLRGGIANMAVDSSGDYLSCSDTLGNIAVWNVKSHKNIKLVHHFENKHSCSCMNMFKNFLLCAYTNGVITVFDLSQGRKVIEIRAHAKWINSIDIRDDRFVSAGEDCMFKVWQLSEMNGKLKVNNLQSEKVEDSMISAAKFGKNVHEIFVAVYDNTEILCYKQ